MTKHIRFVRQHKIKMNIGGILIDPAGKENMKVTTIVFVNENGDVDATQFDTQNETELAEIWWDFCKENNIIIETIEEEE